MKPKLTDKYIRDLKEPPTGNRIYRDCEVPIRVTAAGAKAGIIDYNGRRKTIGQWPAWNAAALIKAYRNLRQLTDVGYDPLAIKERERKAKTVAAACEKLIEEHLPTLRPSTAAEYRRQIEKVILPQLGDRKLEVVTKEDAAKLHRSIAGAYMANRVAATCSVLFDRAVAWGWCTANPFKGLKRHREHRRTRYLRNGELGRLTAALDAHGDQDVADVFRVLLMTGCRLGEALAMKIGDLDLGAGATWLKQHHQTKQRREHRVPLSAPARLLLSKRLEQADAGSVYVFPGKGGQGHRTNVDKAWRSILRAAGISDLHIHDLRHSFATLTISAGASLPVVGSLLGHVDPRATARYAHVEDEVARAAAERVGAVIAPAPAKESAEIVPMQKR